MKRLLISCLLFTGLIASGKNTVTVTFQHQGLTINGRLQLPDGSGPFPVVIVNPGSGANDKDGTLPMSGGYAPCLYPGLLGQTLKPYLGLSEAISDSGYAVLTYDKVEYTYPNPGIINFEKLWLPVKSAIAYLKTRSDIDTAQIVLLGHSEGSSLIPYIAASEPGIKALISLAGPRQPLDSMIAYQLYHFAQLCNGDTAAAAAQGTQILQYFADVRSGNYSSATPAMFGVGPAVWDTYLDVVDSVSYRYNLAALPTLFIGLGDDLNVPVSTELSRFQDEITIPADFYALPGLNHYLTTSGNPAVSQMLTDTIIHWLRGKILLSVPETPAAGSPITLSRSGRKWLVSSAEKLTLLVVSDIFGRVVRRTDCNGFSCTIDLDDLAVGNYIISVVTGKRKSSFKVNVN